MKKLKLTFGIFALLLCISVVGCRELPSNIEKPAAAASDTIDGGTSVVDEGAERVKGIYTRWYMKVIDGFEQPQIAESIRNSEAVSEYRVVYNIARRQYDYYSLMVYADGTGQFTYMVHESENFDTGEIVLREIMPLTLDETSGLTQAVFDNDFYNIPSIHPDEIDGLDGTTIFVEGCDDEKHHFIKMWQPDDTYGISKIHSAFAAFADTIAERPVISFG